MARIATMPLLASLPLLAGSTIGITHPMDCANVLQLRTGQSRAQVRALLGDPSLEAPQGTGWSKTGEPRTDYVFVYGNGLFAKPGIYRTRDEASVAFLDDRLVHAIAYRASHGLTGKRSHQPRTSGEPDHS
jgi:outer membrane protein assembly factor BamE (lipoprotein component of BamABCDE complex)